MNPYETLGVSRYASDAEIKSAYERLLAQKERSPEQLDRLTEAYNQIVLDRETQRSSPSQFIDIRRLINNNMISEADELLEGVPFDRRDSEWYFLKGSIQHSRGWLEDAYENFIRATQLNPNNSEYRAALNQLQWQRQTGNPPGGYNARGKMPIVECGFCNICASMCCANLCCNCISGC